MSGGEAAAVLGVISSIIAIIDGTKKVYDAASSATGLPIAFREVSTRLPIVKEILESTKQHIDDAHIDTASYSVIKTLIEACEDRAKRLKAIFDKVIPGNEDSRLTRYISAAKILGQGERVETLMQALMKDVLLLASKHVMELATSQQVVGLTASIKELSAVEPSLPDAALEDTAFTNNNFGTGPMTNNNVMGNQKYQANYGTGRQFQAEEQIFHMENGPVNEQSFHAPVQQYFSSRNALTEDQVQQRSEHGILEQLKFHDMQERYYDIPEAHQKTFEWIYGRPDLKFVQWLQGGNGIYWITGKAGSGKSTLMKFIYQNPRTRHYLPTDVENTLVSSFFFHERGHNPLLKSQEGLLRAILHSILSKYRSLIPIALSDRFEKLQEDVRSGQHRSSIPAWSTNELRSGFEAIVSQSQVKLHLCLLVDGLDEFSGQHEDIIDNLRHLLPTAADSHVRVQMCLSSRPLAVFEESYSRHTHLQVQDLTADDIKLYVMTKFNEKPRAAYLLTEDPTTTDLIIKEILDKAQGVFLWVTLVVRSLIEGLRNRDDMNTLRRRLSGLPAGLKPLYKRMIETVNPLYHRDAGRTFNMVRLASRPLSPLAMWFSDHEPYEALSPQSILSDAQIEMRHSDTERQLKARTAGLIEISEVKRYHRRERSINSNGSSTQKGATLAWQQFQIQYLHLTVQEFLLGENVPTWLANETSASARGDTFLTIAVCCLRQLRVTKSLDLYDYHYKIPDRRHIHKFGTPVQEDIIFMIMFHIREAEQATNTSSFPYLESLDEEILREQGPIETRMTEYEMRHWTSCRYFNWEEPKEWQSDYIAYLVTIRMTRSVIDAFKRGYNPAAKAGRPLLLYATCGTPAHVERRLARDSPEPALVEELLKWRCDPNQALRTLSTPELTDYGARTVWEAVISHFASHFNSYDGDISYRAEQFSPRVSYDLHRRWLKIIKLFLDHGANPKQLIIQYHWVGSKRQGRMLAIRRSSALSLYDQIFANFDNSLVSKVRASMVAKGAIEFNEEISEETARLYDKGVPEEWVRSPPVSDYTQAVLPDFQGSERERPEAKSRFVAFFQKTLTARRRGQDRRPRTKKRGGCVQS